MKKEFKDDFLKLRISNEKKNQLKKLAVKRETTVSAILENFIDWELSKQPRSVFIAV